MAAPAQPPVMAGGQYGGWGPQSHQLHQMHHLPSVSGPPVAGSGVTSVFVYGLVPDADETYLYRLFSPYGGLESVKVVRDRDTGQSKGFGFVHFSRLEDAQRAILTTNGIVIGSHGKPLQVKLKTQK